MDDPELGNKVTFHSDQATVTLEDGVSAVTDGPSEQLKEAAAVQDANTTAELERGVGEEAITDKDVSIVKRHESYDVAMQHGTSLDDKDIDTAKNCADEQEGKGKLISLWALFRFANTCDVAMVVLGMVMAILAGLALPGHMILFGGVINNFIYHDIATSNLSFLLAGSVSTNVSDGMISCPPDNALFGQIAPFFNNSATTLRDEIGLYSVYYVALAIGNLITAFFAASMLNVSAYRQTKRIREKYFYSIMRQDIGWFDVTDAAQLSTRLSDDMEKIQAGLGEKLGLFLQYMTTFVAGYIIAFIADWRLALVMSTLLPVLAIIAGTNARVIAAFTIRELRAYAEAGSVAEEVIASIRTVSAFGGEANEAERYESRLKNARNEGFKKSFISSIVVGVLYFFIFASFSLAFWYGSTLIISCELSAGDIVTVLLGILTGSFSLGNAIPEIEAFSTALASATIVYEIIDREPEIDWSSSSGETPKSFEGNIEFSDVIFHYPSRPDVQVLRGFDLQVRNGNTVALVGGSGCGKSTTIQLLQRFYNPTAGLITIDGTEIAKFNLRWLRNKIGIVSQEPVLFDTTIAENIRYGRGDISDEDIHEAAKNANAHDFISKLPDGYNTDVGQRGAQLSGGQKQRIAIARALVRKPQILLLDEATSALDTESEKTVQDALDKASKGRTTIVIAHRLSTIRNADVIVALELGRVAEIGTHSELVDKQGLYYNLVSAQQIPTEEETNVPADFKDAVRLSISIERQRRRSTIASIEDDVRRRKSISERQSSLKPSFMKQLSRVTFEDLPLAHPAPFAGRGAFPGPDEVDVSRSVQPRRDSKVHDDAHAIKAADEDELPKLTTLDLLKLNKPDWPLVLVGVIASAIIGAVFPVISLLFGDVLGALGGTDIAAIQRAVRDYCLGFLGLAIGTGVVYFLANFSLSVAGERLTKRLRYEYFKAMLRQEISWFDRKTNSVGALSTRLASEASEVKSATGIRMGAILQTIFGFVVAMVIAFVSSWELSLLLLLFFPLLALGSYLQVRVLRGSIEKNARRLERSGQTAVESIDNIRTVAGLGVELVFYENYRTSLKGPLRSNIRNAFVQAVVGALSQSVVFFLYAAGLSFGAFLVIEGRTSFNQVFKVFSAVVFTALSVGRASSFASDAAKAQLSATKIVGLLKRTPLVDISSKDGQTQETVTGDISAEEVQFHYPTRPDMKILQGMQVSVKAGQTLALVGPSGCGKSTLISLLLRFYDPLAGAVTLDGVDLKGFNLEWLRSQIGLVSQEPILFDASIAENIRYGALDKKLSDEEVVEAAKSANIHSFIQSLPQGYNTNVGSKGTQLSGGQKQRIAIARALIRDPKILLLDEATSALDTESEKIVQEALDKAREGRTSLVIAHRLSTIYNSDSIAVIHNGAVVEQGTHAELMHKRGSYYHLNTVQQGSHH